MRTNSMNEKLKIRIIKHLENLTRLEDTYAELKDSLLCKERELENKMFELKNYAINLGELNDKQQDKIS